VRRTAVGRAQFDPRMFSIRRMRWSWNLRGIMHLQQHLKMAAFSANLNALNPPVQ
jgi:hypothetical protein